MAAATSALASVWICFRWLAFEGFGVDLVDVFGAGGAGGEPAVFGCDFEAADGGVVAGGFGEDGGDGFAGELLCGDLLGGEFGELGFLFLGGGGVDALVDGVAVFFGEVGVDAGRGLCR